MFANDGSIIPSWMVNLGAANKEVNNDFALRSGIVVAVYPPSDEKSYSKTTTEYDVRVNYTSGSTSPSQIIYPHVTVQSIFGGVADYSEWTPRIGVATAKTLGSKVLLLCNNALQVDAFIIGGLKHPNSQKTDPEFKGNHRYIWEFNGLKQSVNDSGDWVVFHRGKTNDDGTVASDSDYDQFGQAQIEMTSNGKITIGYDKFGTDNASIQLSKPDKSLFFYTKSSTRFKSEAAVIMETTNGLKINPGNGDSQAFLRGTTYRMQQAQLHTQLQTHLGALATLIGTAGASLSTFPAPTAVSGAGAALTSSVALITQMITSLASFEAQSQRYLSTHHNFAETP